VPRGWWHSAIPLNEPTFHIAAGIHNKKLLDYVTWIAGNSLKNSNLLRKSLIQDNFSAALLAEIAKATENEILNIENYRKFQSDINAKQILADGIDISKYANNRIIKSLT
ncbi:hypothetical protein P3W83_32730, partial [Cupriavidus basilensis]|nr:hypothetical protein [Cupriavidus basilensis]